MVGSHRDLQVWQKAIELVVECYEVSRQFPEAERFSLTSQVRRAASSIPANIAEGRGRGTTKNFLNFLAITNGSLAELDTHLELAVRLQFISRESKHSLQLRMDEVGRMLTGLRQSLRRKL
jgi:four helix bundle protein